LWGEESVIQQIHSFVFYFSRFLKTLSPYRGITVFTCNKY
jgi:hypothetical protein